MINGSKSIDLIRNEQGVYRKHCMDAPVDKGCVYFSHRWQLFATILQAQSLYYESGQENHKSLGMTREKQRKKN